MGGKDYCEENIISFFLQATCVAYGNDFCQIYVRQGLNYFFLCSPICALRDLLE